MSRSILSLSPDQLTCLHLDAFLAQAEALNHRNRATFTTPFPQAPSRWISHDECTPHPIELTSHGDVDGGRSWLVGSTLDCSFTHSLCAPSYGPRGAPCYDPASLVVLEVVTKVDHYVDSAQFCRDLHDREKGRRYRQLAGLLGAIPGEGALCHFRNRGGDTLIHHVMAVVVEFLECFGLIKGEVLSTDGQLEPSYLRDKGCTYACEGCWALPIDEAARQALGEQLQSGAKRLQLTCPFPEVVPKVREATAQKGHPKDPKVTLLAIESVPQDKASTRQWQRVASLLDLPQDQVPTLRIKGGHLNQGAKGSLVGSCPKMPSDLEAKLGVHVDNHRPSANEHVFGSVHLKTTDLNSELGLELPLGNSTYPANANEGHECVAHRASLPLPMAPGQVHLGDAAYAVTINYTALHDQGVIAIFDYNRRGEHLDEASLLERGYEQYGTPYAPCGRLCRSHGYDSQGDSRQSVCARACPP